jgi:MFS family permease
MSENSDSTQPAGYRDRRTGLMLFGILEILLGSLCAAIVAALFLARLLSPGAASELDQQTFVMAASVYLGMAVILVWLGIGSVLCRRWARSLLLILGWSWLLLGVMTLALLSWMAASLPTEGTLGGLFLVLAIAILGVFLVVLPGALVVFYQNRHVRATCEARDPRQRWTDRCPLPVLTNSVWLAVGGFWFLVLPLTRHSIIPVFGFLATGTIANLCCLAGGAIALYLAYATYRRRMSAWWGMLVAFSLATLSAALTFARVDLLEFYRRAGYAEEQLARVATIPFFTSRIMAWINAAFFVLFLVYLLWIRKYFRKPVDERG